MIYTGVDGKKSFSVNKSLLGRGWSPTQKLGKKICVVPSDLCFVKVEKALSQKPSDLRDYYQLEVSEKFGQVEWDVSLHGDLAILGVYKNFEGEDCWDIDLEIFSLARVLHLLRVDGCVLDLGRRKSTLVCVEGGVLSRYRVLLRGGDYLNSLIGLEEPQRAESLKIEKGLGLKEVEDGLKGILSNLRVDANTPILLSGGGAKLKGLRQLFGRLIENPYCQPEYTSAFGASLKYVVKTPYPDFVKRELSPQELRWAGFSLVGGLLLFGLAYFGTERFWSVEPLREKERTEFKKLFPNAPVRAVREQVLSKASKEESFQLSQKLSELSTKLSSDLKLYSLEFSKDSLLVKGEGKEEVVRGLSPKSVKKTPSGTLEFELELR
jgi:hypothetical protein